MKWWTLYKKEGSGQSNRKKLKKWLLYTFGSYCQGQLFSNVIGLEKGTNLWLVTWKAKSTVLEVGAKVTLSWFSDNEKCKFVSSVLFGVKL